MRIYIAGVISKGGQLSGEVITANIQRFHDAAKMLREAGHDPVNPVELHPVRTLDRVTFRDWVGYMKKDIPELVTCDAIYLLEDWNDSAGARLEAHIAYELGMLLIQEPLLPPEICVLCGLREDASGVRPVTLPAPSGGLMVHRSCDDDVMNDPDIG